MHAPNLLLDFGTRQPDLGQADQRVDGVFIVLARLPGNSVQFLLQCVEPAGQKTTLTECNPISRASIRVCVSFPYKLVFQ